MKTQEEKIERKQIQQKAIVQKKFLLDEFDEKAIFLCQFCGGESCDQQNYLKNKIQPNAIEGLHSNWITQNILAMQRPSERLIKQFGLYGRFKEARIRTVLNLQEPGQHPYCGDGIIPTVGFSYIPQNFHNNGIHCFNESWEDMTATTFQHMMKIMNLFDMSLANHGKISVHCHAGRGRTLLVICSWLIYHQRMSAQDTIKLAIEKRQGVLTRSSQRQFLLQFQNQLQNRWKSYKINSSLKNFNGFTEWQTCSLLSKIKKKIHFTPVLHGLLIKKLRKRMNNDSMGIMQAFININSVYFKHKWNKEQQERLEFLKERVNVLDFDEIKEDQDIRVLMELLFDFYQELPFTIITALSMHHLTNAEAQFESKAEQKSQGLFKDCLHLKVLLHPSIVHDIGLSAFAVILDFLHLINMIAHHQLHSHSGSNHQKQLDSKEDQHQQKINSEIHSIMFIRLALLLLSKKKYFPQLFPAQKNQVGSQRECKIQKYYSKIKKHLNEHILQLTSFLQKLSKQIPQSKQQIGKIVFKFRKIESNVYDLTAEKRKGGKEYYNSEEIKKIYEEAHIKL